MRTTSRAEAERIVAAPSFMESARRRVRVGLAVLGEALVVASSLLYLAEMFLGAVSWLVAAVVAVLVTAGVLLVDLALLRGVRRALDEARHVLNARDLDRAA